jgi:hypothetical protein
LPNPSTKADATTIKLEAVAKPANAPTAPYPSAAAVSMLPVRSVV